jgi:ADP-ribosyl-[dinitrogen reductase] hydrolase
LTAEFLAWYRSDPKDIGNTTRAALALVAEGVPPKEAGATVSRAIGDRGAGNGSVMRCAPVAIRFSTDPARLVSASLASAAITHADRRCTWGAVAINQAIADLLRGGDLDGVLAAAVLGVPDLDVRDAVLNAGDRPREQVKSGGFVLDTIGAALWCLLTQNGYEDAVVTAVGLGDDTDTTAAVAGALAGARYGEQAIPARWRDAVQHRAEIREIALRLLGYAGGPAGKALFSTPSTRPLM